MSKFRVDYKRKGTGFLSDEAEPGWQYLPEEVEANGYTLRGGWVTFWADHTHDPTWAPPPVLRVRVDDLLRIEWLDRPKPVEDSVSLRITYHMMTLFTDDGDLRRHDDLHVGGYRMGKQLTYCTLEGSHKAGLVDLDPPYMPPVLAVRTEIVERIERRDLPISVIDRKASTGT